MKYIMAPGRGVEQRDVGRIEPAGGQRRDGQRLVLPVLDAMHRRLVRARHPPASRTTRRSCACPSFQSSSLARPKPDHGAALRADQILGGDADGPAEPRGLRHRPGPGCAPTSAGGSWGSPPCRRGARTSSCRTGSSAASAGFPAWRRVSAIGCGMGASRCHVGCWPSLSYRPRAASPRAGTQGNTALRCAALGTGYFADAKFRHDRGRCFGAKFSGQHRASRP